MKLVTWSIINNEIDYLQDILNFHLPWLDQMYFLDTGSTDGSLELLKNWAEASKKVILEEYPTKFTPQWEVEWRDMSNPFPEVEVRNFALQRVVELCQPDWLIQLDGDEVFLPVVKETILKNTHHAAIGHSTINPVCKLEEHVPERRGGYTLYDPHVRIWPTKTQVYYRNNPAFEGKQFHCIPTVKSLNGRHIFHHPLIKFTDEIFHFHLHWMYGKKVEKFFAHQGIEDRFVIESKQTLNKFKDLIPQIFWQRRSEWIENL